LTLANLGAAWPRPDPSAAGGSRRGLLAFADRALTFVYFIPTMITLMKATGSPESVAAAARWWRLNFLRHAIVLAASLRALQRV
jgi:hypothetical protein